MKKLFPILGAVMLVILISSCTKKYITPINRTVFSDPIPQSSWIRTTDGKSDSTTIKVPDLDEYTNENGGVLVYLKFFKGVYEQIPEVYDGISYSYYHYNGNIVLYAQPVGGGTPTSKPPGGMVAKIVLIDSTSDF